MIAAVNAGMNPTAAQRELANRIAGHAKAPEEAIRSVFEGLIKGLQEIGKVTIESNLKERIWNQVSKDKLVTIKETFILEFCSKILGGSNEDIEEMLEEHKRTGFIKNPIHSAYVKVAYQLNHDNIINAVCAKASSMSEEWIPEVVAALEKEGIKLPEPKKTEAPSIENK